MSKARKTEYLEHPVGSNEWFQQKRILLARRLEAFTAKEKEKEKERIINR
jgi:hypothetical protein